MIKICREQTAEFPVFAVKAPGGVLSWQDWMCDSVALMGTGQADRVALFSFATGAVLETGMLQHATSDAMVSDKIGYSLTSDDLVPEAKLEGLLWKHEPFESSGLLFKAIQCQTHGDLETAVATYQELLRKPFPLPRVANLLGLCLRVSGRLAESEQAYLQEIEIAPHYPDVYCNLGILYLRTEREHLARSMFEKALERDQFHLNSLLQWSKFLQQSGEEQSKIAISIHVRLLQLYANVPKALEHLMQLATAQNFSLEQFGAHLRANAGPFADGNTLQLMNRVENLRLNGALMAALCGYSFILKKTMHMPMAAFFQHWLRRRIALVDAVRPSFLDQAWHEMLDVIKSEHPTFAELLNGTPEPKTSTDPDKISREQPPDAKTQELSALTPEEFFFMALEEVMRDGQIKPEETHLILRLKNLLRIDEATHVKLFKEAVAHTRSNPLADDGGDFDPQRLFKRLVWAVIRDGKVEPHEKKLLAIASEALELSSQQVKTLIAEVQKR